MAGGWFDNLRRLIGWYSATSASLPTLVPTQVLDNYYVVGNDGSFSTPGNSLTVVTGTWQPAAVGGFCNLYRYATVDGNVHTARFTFSGLSAGTYKLYWGGITGAGGATDVPFRAYEGDTLLATWRVSQRTAPQDGVFGTEYGGGQAHWGYLGEVLTRSGALAVTLSTDGASAGYSVLADGLMAVFQYGYVGTASDWVFPSRDTTWVLGARETTWVLGARETTWVMEER